jgi:hypothetical protein
MIARGGGSTGTTKRRPLLRRRQVRFGSLADGKPGSRHVRLVPVADIRRTATSYSIFHPVVDASLSAMIRQHIRSPTDI